MRDRARYLGAAMLSSDSAMAGVIRSVVRRGLASQARGAQARRALGSLNAPSDLALQRAFQGTLKGIEPERTLQASGQSALLVKDKQPRLGLQVERPQWRA